MSKEDLKEKLGDADDTRLDEILKNLESKGLVRLYRDAKKTIALAKATCDGLRKAEPLGKYKWYPEWLDKNFIF